MKKLALFVGVAACAMSAPALAGPTVSGDKPIQMAQVEFKFGESDRDHDQDRELRHRHGDRDDCRTVTVRERHGDDVVVRKIYRCD